MAKTRTFLRDISFNGRSTPTQVNQKFLLQKLDTYFICDDDVVNV